MNVRLKILPTSFKWALSLYFFLVTLGFGFAALMSHNRYDFDHEKTIQYYLGDPADGPDAFQKPYAQLLGVTHVHSFVLPLVFLTIWLALQYVPLRSQKFKVFLYLGGTFAILIYNAAPYLVRFVAPHWVIAFTIGGIGLFVFSFVPISLIFYEMLLGFKTQVHL